MVNPEANEDRLAFPELFRKELLGVPAIVQDEDLRRDLGLRIKELRKQRGWTQRQLAEKLALRHSQLNKYEGGYNVPPVEKLADIAEVFETTIDYLVTGNQTDERPLHNRRLLERFRALEAFGAADQDAVITLIDAVIVRRRVEGAVKPPARPALKRLKGKRRTGT